MPIVFYTKAISKIMMQVSASRNSVWLFSLPVKKCAHFFSCFFASNCSFKKMGNGWLKDLRAQAERIWYAKQIWIANEVVPIDALQENQTSKKLIVQHRPPPAGMAPLSDLVTIDTCRIISFG